MNAILRRIGAPPHLTALGIGVVVTVVLFLVQPRALGQPAGYFVVPGSPDATLNPAHVGAVGGQFTQDCSGVPVDVPAGGVAWHFILPQATRVPTPEDIFAELSVTFAASGEVTLTTFGPPHGAHAWIVTSTDDTLLSGEAEVFSEFPEDWAGTGETFNLSHTCVVPLQPTTTTTSSTTTTTNSTTTTTTASTTTTMPFTSTTRPTTTTDPGGSALASTGAQGEPLVPIALALIATGAFLVAGQRLRMPGDPRTEER